MRILIAILALLASPAQASVQLYDLDRAQSRVVFTWHLGSDDVNGQMPVSRADLALDFDHAANSHFSVALDVAASEAGFPFATQAMKGPKILDAATYPEITFVSTAVRPTATGAVVDGNLTIRGVTRPATFTAQLYRQKGTEAGDRSRLSVLLTGSVSRSAFGATGWSNLAADEITFQVLARISLSQ